jgi:hypothetical protein
VKKLFDVAQGKNRVDFAIVSEPGVFGVRENLPNAQTSGLLLEYLRNRPDFVEIGRVPDPQDKAYWIFKRKVTE